ncbi:MAG: TraR/DksA family transcriptional regulator [Deltaproteobacteria bacterium]|nr:TraR/DksA family transcriptional regulator [Deltaproteobacteria bacterium]
MTHREMLQHVRGELVRKMEGLQDALKQTATRMKDESFRMADFVDQAAAEHDRSVELSMRGREREQIREIHETILCIDQGRFGVCRRCGKVIPPARLLLAPMSRLCTTCKQQLELDSRTGYSAADDRVDRYAC